MKTRQWMVLTSLGFLLGACARTTDPTGQDFQQVDADMILVDMVSNMTTQGIRKARLQGDTANVFDDSTTIKVKGVKLVFFDERGAESGSLTSRTGDFNTNTQAMIARGNAVLITTVGNRRIETEELHYDPTTHRLWSKVHTVMTEGGSRLTGAGFEADDKFQNFNITNMTGRVRGLKF
jgi:lipopolysaccharide export system protein LptC